MADFMYVFRGGLLEASPEKMQQHMERWTVWMKELGGKGVFKTGEPLEATGKVVHGPGKTVTDGPFAEAKDVVGGFMILTAKTIEEAVELSRGCPILDYEGTVEVRPVRLMQRP